MKLKYLNYNSIDNIYNNTLVFSISILDISRKSLRIRLIL